MTAIGYESLAKKMGKKPESIKRMLSVEVDGRIEKSILFGPIGDRA